MEHIKTMSIPLVSKEDMYYIEKNNTDNKILKKIEIEMKLRGFSIRTINAYLLYNEKFLEFIKKSPEDVTEDDIKEFLAYKMEESISNGSLAYIKSALKFSYNEILGKNFSFASGANKNRDKGTIKKHKK